MTNAGWYPDPAGAPDTFRYWDGQAWSQMTTSQPSGGAAAATPTPAPATPPPATPPPATPPTALPPSQEPYQQPYQQPYQPQYQPQPQPTWNPTPPPGGGTGGPGGTGGGSTGKTVGIVVAAVLVLALLGVGGFFGIRALSGDDDGDGGDKKADDPTSQATDGPTDEPTDETSSTVRPSGIQCTGGKPEPTTAPDPKATTLTGGGLTIPIVDGYRLDVGQSPAHTFADNVIPQTKEVVPRTWIAEYAVGAVPRANGFEGVEPTAEIIMQCITTNDQMYRGFQSRTDLKREEITVDGRPGYRVSSELRVKQTGLPYEGDVTTVIVVDTGNPSEYGLFIGLVPIGDQTLGAQVEDVVAAITVS
ncbi:DUF2510 domain-containing protein [Pimelobacter simplex]|uniref:DUF2510 domain-containing protein n=1 Tax=Nocardioides simplex TaxID=2045 RepID=UPI003AAB617E